MNTRKSWDTSVKHIVRNGLFDTLPENIQGLIPRSNYYAWLNEPNDKYIGCEVADYIQQEVELLRQLAKHNKAKQVIRAYFQLHLVFLKCIEHIKGVKQVIANQKELVVNAIEQVKSVIPVEEAIKLFQLSRSTYQHYKVLVKNTCEQSYFLWCVKKYPHQLLKKEILQIKAYMDQNLFWSKSSVYLKAVRDKRIGFSLSTWYKYCSLLGYSKRRFTRKNKLFSSLETSRPNELWTADVTILKTRDGIKHYLHFLMDHYSKRILSFSIENSSNALVIKKMLLEAVLLYKPSTELTFLTDGGSENINQSVSEVTREYQIRHLVAQKDIQFSNSSIEAFNKIIKYQFLLPKDLANRNQLEQSLPQDIAVYNQERPQLNLSGCTPDEIFYGQTKDFSQFTSHFTELRAKRIKTNQQNTCRSCQ